MMVKLNSVCESNVVLVTAALDLLFNYCIYLFCSGEKTSAKDWSGFIEIKGRVKLDAFQKFLQELPMSRSRAIMVSQVSFHCAKFWFCYYSPEKRDVLSLCVDPSLLMVQYQHRMFPTMVGDIYARLMRVCINAVQERCLNQVLHQRKTMLKYTTILEPGFNFERWLTLL